MQQTLILDRQLISKYDQTGPRYTSYPTAIQFEEGFGAQEYKKLAQQSNETERPLSLYFHIPFCDTICFYCACNKIATKDRSKAVTYLDYLYREIELQSRLFDHDRVVEQLHWGGGTPTFISHQQMRDLMGVTGKYFNLLGNDEGEYSIEIDPREATAETIAVLRDIGFNRMSLGVQDFDEEVQTAVNRIQSEKETFTVMDAARAEGFRSVSVDLIYGLPRQSLAGFQRTLERVVAADPDRLSIFNYAHLPHVFKPQRRIDESELPSAEAKLEILQMTSEFLANAGYQYIGMDHFAKPDDELAIAQQQGNLYRNFQGYSTHANCDLIGLGVTSIGSIGAFYAQNSRTLDDYYAAIDAEDVAVFRGMHLSQDDEIRRDLITQIICNFRLDFDDFAKRWDISFDEYFAEELKRIAAMRDDGLITLDDKGFQILPAGRLLVRNICMQFDAYMKHHEGSQRFSKVI